MMSRTRPRSNSRFSSGTSGNRSGSNSPNSSGQSCWAFISVWRGFTMGPLLAVGAGVDPPLLDGGELAADGVFRHRGHVLLAERRGRERLRVAGRPDPPVDDDDLGVDLQEFLVVGLGALHLGREGAGHRQVTSAPPEARYLLRVVPVSELSSVMILGWPKRGLMVSILGRPKHRARRSQARGGGSKDAARATGTRAMFSTAGPDGTTGKRVEPGKTRWGNAGAPEKRERRQTGRGAGNSPCGGWLGGCQCSRHGKRLVEGAPTALERRGQRYKVPSVTQRAI